METNEDLSAMLCDKIVLHILLSSFMVNFESYVIHSQR